MSESNGTDGTWRDYRDMRIVKLQAENERWKTQSNTHYMQVCHLDKELADTKAENELLSNPWVSVDERLPKVGETVLTIGSHIDSITAYAGGVFPDGHYRWFTYETDEWVTGVTHWMPIPVQESK